MCGARTRALLVDLAIPAHKQLLVVVEDGHVEALEGPVLARPNDARQVEEAGETLLESMHNNLNPVRVNAVVAVRLVNLSDGRQLRLELTGHLIDEAHTLVVRVELLDGHRAVEHVDDLLVVHPREDHVGSSPAIQLLELLAHVIKTLVILHLHAEFEVLVRIIHMVAHEIAVDLDSLDLSHRYSDHEERIERDTDAIAHRAVKLRLVLTVEQIAND